MQTKTKHPLPRVQQTAMLDELHLQNSATATHHQVQDAIHCPPTAQYFDR